jgi:hypothetical protein
MALGAGPANIRACRPCGSVLPQREALGSGSGLLWNRSSPPLVRSVSIAYKHVDAGCLCLLPCRSLARCKPANRSLRDFPSCLCATARACRSFQTTVDHYRRFHCNTTITGHCVSSATVAIHTTSDILGESHSAVGSTTSDTACSKPCTSLLASISNPNSSGRTHRAQQQLHTLPSCQKWRPCHSFNSLTSGQQPVCHHDCDSAPYCHSL